MDIIKSLKEADRKKLLDVARKRQVIDLDEIKLNLNGLSKSEQMVYLGNSYPSLAHYVFKHFNQTLALSKYI